jgi:hypothetical protein
MQLRIGDHVRVVGRWVIDHHPEYCKESWAQDNGRPCHRRGWLLIGLPHIELHPFRWDEITLVREPAVNQATVETLSLAAPLYEEQYLGGWKHLANELAGVAGRVFISDDRSNFHQSVSATTHVQAPPPDSGETLHSSVTPRRSWRTGPGLASD